MHFEIQPLSHSDGPEVAKLVAESFKGNPFQRIIFPEGHNQSSMNKLAEARLKAIDDPDGHALKVVNTENGEIAAVAVWAHTKAMSDREWEYEREHCMDKYSEARKDILMEFVLKEQDAKQRIMGSSRWWGKSRFCKEAQKTQIDVRDLQNCSILAHYRSISGKVSEECSCRGGTTNQISQKFQDSSSQQTKAIGFMSSMDSKKWSAGRLIWSDGPNWGRKGIIRMRISSDIRQILVVHRFPKG